MNLIFPKNVNKAVSDAKTISTGEKLKIYIITGIIANIAGGLLLVPFMESIGIAPWVTITSQTLLVVSILIYIYRMFIFNENEKIQEMNDGLSDSFSKYCYLRNLGTGEIITAASREVPLYEFDNGSLAFYIKFYFGEETDKGTVGTRMIFEDIHKILGQHRFEVSTVVDTERFSDTVEHTALLKSMSDIENPKLSRAMMEITRSILDMSEKLSNVETVTFRIKTKSSYQRYDIHEVLTKIYSSIKDTENNFRSVQIVFRDDLLKHFKGFYRLGDIDVARMRIRDSKSDPSSFRKYVEIFSLVDENGVAHTKKSAETKEINIAKKIKL